MTVTISSPDKLLFPADGLSKADIADYYDKVAEWMLPHVRDRPLSLMRFPDGIEAEGFFQKNTPAHYPSFIKRVEADEARRHGDPRVVVTNADGSSTSSARTRSPRTSGCPAPTACASPTGSSSTSTRRPGRTSPRSAAQRAGRATCCARSGSSRSPR